VSPAQGGVYQVTAEARHGSDMIGSARDTFLVGAFDPEFADPRMNAVLLRRIAEATGGTFLTEATASQLPGLLTQRAPDRTPLERRPLWHHPLVFAAVLILLALEWVLRRRVGLL
jgi:hypothetical protein